jgi:hypothetical protein
VIQKSHVFTWVEKTLNTSVSSITKADIKELLLSIEYFQNSEGTFTSIDSVDQISGFPPPFPERTDVATDSTSFNFADGQSYQVTHSNSSAPLLAIVWTMAKENEIIIECLSAQQYYDFIESPYAWVKGTDPTYTSLANCEIKEEHVDTSIGVSSPAPSAAISVSVAVSASFSASATAPSPVLAITGSAVIIPASQDEVSNVTSGAVIFDADEAAAEANPLAFLARNAPEMHEDGLPLQLMNYAAIDGGQIPFPHNLRILDNPHRNMPNEVHKAELEHIKFLEATSTDVNDDDEDQAKLVNLVVGGLSCSLQSYYFSDPTNMTNIQKGYEPKEFVDFDYQIGRDEYFTHEQYDAIIVKSKNNNDSRFSKRLLLSRCKVCCPATC